MSDIGGQPFFVLEMETQGCFGIIYNKKEDGDIMLKFISITEALQLCYGKKVVLIDVRKAEEYKKGHLPMAENVPLDTIIKGDYMPAHDLPVLFYCDTGAGSLQAAKKMGERGVEAYSVAGGLSAYKGYLEKEEEKLWTMVFVGDRS